MTALFLWFLALGPPDPARILELLEAERLADADAALTALHASAPQDRATQFLEGYRLFLAGDYEAARAKMDSVSEDSPQPLAAMRRQILATSELVRDFKRHETAHFSIGYPEGPETILVPYAAETLEAARQALAEDFDWEPKEKIRVEIYRTPSDLARVSTLTEKEIETSGTIALCKWNRIMIVSPRALVRGYSWRDALSHELTHYFVTHLSGNRVPIWLQEGIAKFEEQRWRNTMPPGMPPTTEHLLARALQADKLIPFARMHPSMAKLPSQQQVAVAFAEVYTAIELIYKTKGRKALGTLVQAMEKGASDREAVARVMGTSFEHFEAAWRNYLRSLHLKVRPGLVPRHLAFKRQGTSDRTSLDEEELPPKTLGAARKFVRLGGLLRARGHLEAARIEYERAMALFPQGEPVLAHKLARTLLELGRFDQAASAARAALDVYPDLPSVHVTLAEIALKKDATQEAESHLLAALRINPFDPRVHCRLSEIWVGARAKVEAEACHALAP